MTNKRGDLLLLAVIWDFGQVLYNRFLGREQGLCTEETILEGFNF